MKPRNEYNVIAVINATIPHARKTNGNDITMLRRFGTRQRWFSRVLWSGTHRKHHEAFATHVHHSSFDISFITEEGNYRRDHTSDRAENCHEPCNSS